MKNYRYILEPYKSMKSKHTCPSCGCKKRFTRYVDINTGEYLNINVGRCDRLDNCAYHLKPKQYFENNKLHSNFNSLNQLSRNNGFIKPKTIIPTFIPFDIFNEGLGKGVDANNFIVFLTNFFGKEVANKLIAKYYISTSQLWNGATVFWQIDAQFRVRTGKIMLYDPITGKRNKTKNNWVHKVLKLCDFNLQQCFFGEHLLKDKTKTVAIVESEKTAVIMSYFLPEYIWIASCGKEGLTADKFKVLNKRMVILFPDLSSNKLNENCFSLWCKKANEFKSIANVFVSDFLEANSKDFEKIAGFDIADFFIESHLNQKPTNYCM